MSCQAFVHYKKKQNQKNCTVCCYIYSCFVCFVVQDKLIALTGTGITQPAKQETQILSKGPLASITLCMPGSPFFRWAVLKMVLALPGMLYLAVFVCF